MKTLHLIVEYAGGILEQQTKALHEASVTLNASIAEATGSDPLPDKDLETIKESLESMIGGVTAATRYLADLDSLANKTTGSDLSDS